MNFLETMTNGIRSEKDKCDKIGKKEDDMENCREKPEENTDEIYKKMKRNRGK